MYTVHFVVVNEMRRLFPMQLLALLGLCFVCYLGTAGGHFSSTDEEDLYTNTAILAGRVSPWLFGGDGRGEGGLAQRAPQEIGQSLVAQPWYWAGVAMAGAFHPQWRAYIRRFVMTLFNLFVTLLTVWVLYWWARRLFTARAAVLTAAFFGLGTLAWPYSQTFYREPLVGFCLLLGFWYAAGYRASGQRRDFLISSAALILAVATKFVAAVVIPFWLASFVDLRFLKRRRFAALPAAMVCGVVLVALFTLPSKQELLRRYLEEISADIAQNQLTFLSYGLPGLTVSYGKGLLLYAPPVLLSMLGFPDFFRRHRRDALAIAGCFLLFLAIYSTRRGWHGGACWGPRYLLPVLPLLMLPAGAFVDRRLAQVEGMDRWWRRPAPVALAGVFVAGFAVQLAAVSIFPLNFYFLKGQEGVISAESWIGGAAYLREIYFEPAHMPVLGHGALAVQRVRDLVRDGRAARQGVFPADAYNLWLYMIGLDRLDYWWLDWLYQPDPAVAPNGALGVVTAPPEQAWLSLARTGGIQWNRWQVNWRDVEASPGAYDFTIPDREVAAFEAAGIEVAGLLTYPPDWALRPGTLVPRELDDPDDGEPSAWFEFVYQVVARYPQIEYWEIWNEPDMAMFWGGTVEDYFQLLRLGYQAVKEANPEAQVLMSGLAYWPDPAFFPRLLDLIVADPEAGRHHHYFDISAWHWYGRASDLYDKVIWARSLMQRRGLEKPIWINEMNVALTPLQVDGHEELQWTASAQEQAAFVVQGYANAMAAGVERVFVFRLDDANMDARWGIVTNDLAPRPAYTALQAVAEFLAGTTVQSRIVADGITRIIFGDGQGREIWVVWNQRPTVQEISVPVVASSLKVGLPDRRTFLVAAEDGVATVALPPATANRGNNEQDYFIGGMPLFLFVSSDPTPRG